MKRKFSALTDNDLVSMIKSGNREAETAFTEVYNRYSPTVHAYCLRILNNKQLAEDLFQETFIRFYQNLKPENNVVNLSGFLIKIARNLCLNYKRDKDPDALNIDDIEVYQAEYQQYEKNELLELIKVSLDLLEHDYREAFVLREYDGLPYEEIAQLTGTSVTNAKSRVFRAKQMLKDILSPYLKDLYSN